MGEQRNRFHQAVQQIVAQAHSVEEESPIPFSVTHGILSDAKDHFEAQSLVVEVSESEK
jgi:hypothetical protein